MKTCVYRGMLSGAFIAMASMASAICPEPPIGGNDIVLKYGSSLATYNKGAIGRNETLSGGNNNRAAGATYYDHHAGTLKVCNGTKWWDLTKRVASNGPTSFAVGSIWSIDVANWPSPPRLQVPMDDSGDYLFYWRIWPTSKTCHFEFQNTSGQWKPIAIAEASGSAPAQKEITKGAVSLYAQPHNADRYMRAVMYHNPMTFDDQQYAEKRGRMYWPHIGEVFWNGKLRVRSQDTCNGYVRIGRIR